MDKAPEEKLTDWFENPVSHLRDTYGGDAAFVPLALSFSLAERLLNALITKDGKSKKNDRAEYLNKVFGVDLAIAELFWNMYRDGMMHCAQPYNGKLMGEDGWGWDISSKHGKLPERKETKEEGKFIALNPWEWFQHVVDTYAHYPDIVRLTDLRKLGEIRETQSNPAQTHLGTDYTHQTREQSLDIQSQTGVRYPQTQ